MSNTKELFIKHATSIENNEAGLSFEQFEKALSELPSSGIRREMIDKLVDKFLAWELPKDFSPDCGISFNSNNGQVKPIGTNLFTATQAKQMFEHLLAFTKEERECDECNGTGKEICTNPDHGFIEGVGGETQRLGCPV
ncbi:MAG: hypothetical protein WC269_05835, partial [Candidatus Gracilibacteria bacterium]